MVIFGCDRLAEGSVKNGKKIKGRNVRILYITNMFVYFSSPAVPESILVIPVTDCKRHSRDVWLVMPDRTPPLWWSTPWSPVWSPFHGDLGCGFLSLCSLPSHSCTLCTTSRYNIILQKPTKADVYELSYVLGGSWDLRGLSADQID